MVAELYQHWLKINLECTSEREHKRYTGARLRFYFHYTFEWDRLAVKLYSWTFYSAFHSSIDSQSFRLGRPRDVGNLLVSVMNFPADFRYNAVQRHFVWSVTTSHNV